MKKEVRVFLIALVIVFFVSLVMYTPKLKTKEPVVEKPAPIEAIPEDVKEVVAEEGFKEVQFQEKVVVQILHNRIEPKVVTIKPGTMVVWINKDQRAHKMVTKDRSYMGKRLEPDESDYSVFNNEGEYDYFDVNFDYMQGTVIVAEDTGSMSAITGGVIFNIKQFLRELFWFW